MFNYQETYTSTRKRVNCPSKECIARGISSDGGLFIRDGFDDYPSSEGDVNLSYGELAKKVFSYFFPDFSSEELDEAISKAYQSGNFEEDILRLSSFGDVSFLELYHGPTFAFKDMALTVLPHLLAKSKASEANHKKAMILTATSG
ncbi:MAG: threonine synthase, partial [Bacilli bacterium]|nr:threonine synthase [Bacilli bacterium]